MPTAAGYCFTLNNYTEDDVTRLRTLPDGTTKYMVFGRERGASGTPHLQGYVVFRTRKTLTDVKRLLGERIHLERVKGTPQQASEYCKKDGDYVESGTLPQPGKRTDLESAIERLRDTRSLTTVADEYSSVFVRHYRGLQAYLITSSALLPRNFKTLVS